jgi:hypothetical protein
LSGVALAGDLLVGAIVPLHSRGPFFPREAPQYALCGANLVAIEGLSELQNGPNERILVEIVEVGRHFATGKLAGKSF